MNKIILISIMVLASVFAVPIAMAAISITSNTLQAGPAGSASINGEFTVNNLETYNDAVYTVELISFYAKHDSTMDHGAELFNPGEGTNISKETNQLFSYNMGVTGTGNISVRTSVTGFYYNNTSLGMNGDDGYYSSTSLLSKEVEVDSTLPEFSSAIFPILLSMILFGIIRRKVE